MNDAFIGIDVAFAKRKRLPVSVCTWRDGRLIPEALRLLPLEPPRGHGNVATLDEARVFGLVEEAVDYVVQVCEELRLAPRRIAIDAPSVRTPVCHVRQAAAHTQGEILCGVPGLAGQQDCETSKFREMDLGRLRYAPSTHR